VLSYRSFLTKYPGDTVLDVVGEVLNNRPEAWFYRYATVRFYNSTGHLVHTDDATFPLQYARARSRVPFQMEILPPSGYTHYTVSVVSEPPGSYPAPLSASLSPSPSWLDSGQNRHYPGAIKNTSSKTEFLEWVYLTLYDANGNVRYVNGAPTVPDSLRSGATGGFDVVFANPTGVNAGAFIHY
jgi:hypothetical protein